MTELGFRCPQCGTPLGYQGLCWKLSSAMTFFQGKRNETFPERFTIVS